jgi:hypothetical protein
MTLDRSFSRESLIGVHQSFCVPNNREGDAKRLAYIFQAPSAGGFAPGCSRLPTNSTSPILRELRMKQRIAKKSRGNPSAGSIRTSFFRVGMTHRHGGRWASRDGTLVRLGHLPPLHAMRQSQMGIIRPAHAVSHSSSGSDR